MENASKALIIAGSILVSIVIITLGVMVVNNVTDTINKTNLSAQEVQAYNSPFEGYVGTKTGTQVKTLLTTVNSHNRAETDESRYIGATLDGAVSDTYDADKLSDKSKTEASTILPSIKTGYTYDVKFGYDSNSGLITMVYVNQVKKGSSSGN